VDLFDRIFGVAAEEIEFELRGRSPIPWADYWLNPRALRGSDFLMRWSQGVWSEERLKEAVNETSSYYALPYGPSGTAPDDDPRAVELYFLRLEKAGFGQLKRPDLLIFRRTDQAAVDDAVSALGGVGELPFTSEDEPLMRALLAKAVLAIECENSLWVARQMPLYGKPLKPMKRLGGKLGLKKNPVVPTVIVKEQDLPPLRQWQARHGIKIHIWHVFYDIAFGIALDYADELIARGLIEPREQVFQAAGGQTTTKTTYNIYYHYAYELGEAREQPSLAAAYVIDKNGHILPYVKFDGGRMVLSGQALTILDGISEMKDEAAS
jgi:hypothetical protein